MARLLVTGGAGFIGANFVHYWLAEHPGDRLVVLDALTYAGNLANLQARPKRAPEFRFVHGDICDTPLVEQLLREEQLDTIVHFAAESHVDRSIEGPGCLHRDQRHRHAFDAEGRAPRLARGKEPCRRIASITSRPMRSMARSARTIRRSRNRRRTRPIHRTRPARRPRIIWCGPITTPMACRPRISNCSNNYGPYQFPEKLIPLMIAQLLAGKVAAGLRRRPQHPRLAARRGSLPRHRGGAERGRPGEVYNIGGRSECENIHLVRMLCSIVDDYLAFDAASYASTFPNCAAAQGEISERLMRFVKDRPGHDRRYAIDSAKIERECALPAADLAGGRPARHGALVPGTRRHIALGLATNAGLKVG